MGGSPVDTFNPAPDWELYGCRFTISVAGDYAITFSDWDGSTDHAFIDHVYLFKEGASASLGTLVAAQRIVSTYNSQGLMDTITSYDASISGNVVNQVKRQYNGFGQMTAEYQKHGAAVNINTSPRTTYSYDTAAHGSRLSLVTYPDNSTVSYTYGAANSINDVISRLGAMNSSSSTLESYQYLGLSTVVERDQANGDHLTYMASSSGEAGDKYAGLDRFGRIVDQKWIHGTTGVDEYTYKFDRDSNVIEKDNVVAGHSKGLDEYYTYDGLNRLTVMYRGGPSSTYQTFNYDGNGNVLNSAGAAGYTHTVNSQNEITSGGVVYDNNGNVTSDDLGRSLVYDAWNRLVAIYDVGGTLLKSYTYDGMGRLANETYITASFTLASNDFYYSGSQMIEEYAGSNTLVRNFFSPVYVNAIIRRDRDTDNNGTLDEKLYFTQDANFNVTSATDGSGNVQKYMIYDAYGNVLFRTSNFMSSSSNTLNFNSLWQGGWRESTTGLTLFGARWYSVTLRWIAGEPSGGSYVDGMNLYLPMADNPINRVDPSGKITIYIHGVESDSTGYDRFVAQAMKTWPASGQPAGSDSLQWRVYFNWSYADGTNPVTNASDSIGDRDKAGSHWYSDGMSTQNWAASDKLRTIVDELHALITKYPCLKNEPINIVAHSQGAAITLSALQAGMKVDNVIFMGSPLDKEIVGAKSHNTDLPAGAKNAGSISNFWSSSDDTARYKGGIGGFGLPASVIGGNISDYQMNGVDHFGDSGWWSGSWLAAQAKTAAGAAINKVIYGQKCNCDAAVKKEFQTIYAEAVHFL